MAHFTRLSRQDVRLALRSFARQPGFAITAVLSLGLAIALNTTMYSVLDAMMNPKLDIHEPDRLYSVQLWGDLRGKLDSRHRNELLESGMKTYESLTYQTGAFTTVTVELANRYVQPVQIYVAPNFVDVYGVRPQRGRGFGQSDYDSDVPPVMISDRLAATLSPDEPFKIGAKIYVDGTQRPVIGILGRGAVAPSYQRPDVFMLPPPELKWTWNVIRLRPGVTIEQANAEFSLLSARVAAAVGEDPKYTRYDLKPLTQSQFHPRAFHYALIASVIAVLFVACANLANLQLARGIGRSREIALRTALGAARRDIVLQLLLESALLGAAGLIVGVLLTFWATHVLDSRIPRAVAEYVVEPQISWRVFAFAMIAGLACVLLVGLFPALRVSRVDPNELLKSGAGTGSNKKNRQQYGIMVAAEIGFSLALLSGTALVVRTALHIRAVKMGYDTRPLSVGSMFLRAPQDTSIDAVQYGHQLLTRLKSIAGVTDVAIARRGSAIRGTVTVDERAGSPREVDAPMFGYSVVTPGYFRTIGLPILKGRGFLEGGSPIQEVIVDQHTARGLWPGVDPIGQEIKLGEYKSDAPWLRVVGVVPEINDYRQLLLYNRDVKPSRLGAIYVSEPLGETMTVGKYGSSFSFIVRAPKHPERVPAEIKRLLPRTGMARYVSAESMDEALGVLRERQRHDFVASIFLTFTCIAVGLASLGIFAIVSHSVAERKRELGVRIALGATARNVLHAVLREGNVVALAGVAVGLLMTKYTAGWLAAFIFEDDQYNAPVFAGMAAILFTVAVLSAIWPAFRATRIDPVESLRSE